MIDRVTPANIPLNKEVAQTSVEMLKNKEAPKKGAVNNDSDDDYESELDGDSAPNYDRERIGSRIGQTPEDAKGVEDIEHDLDSEDVVPMLFPTTVKLNDRGLMHTWAPGVHMVPVSLAGKSPKEAHFWLKHNKVRRAGKVMPRPEPEEADVEEA